ncbi:hypothetical protein CRUP_009711 [Coryphaenoides rupestris]|nr:hypothetical protein CRUP_009711 [Coryphaenoides rupestris]
MEDSYHKADQQTVQALRNLAHRLRIHSIRATTAAGSGHPTSCCSVAEIMSVLFFNSMKYHPEDPKSIHNDRFILSKAFWYTSGERSEVEGGGGRAEEAEAAAPEAEAGLLGWSTGGLLLAECWKALGERSTDSPGPTPDSPGPATDSPGPATDSPGPAPDTARAWFTATP